MTIKVGDKVRIKTEEELLADGWKPIYSTRNSIVSYSKLGWVVWLSQCGIIIKVTDVERNYVFYGIGSICADAIAEVIYDTLDEYICSLPLEERAKQFIHTMVLEHKHFSIVTGHYYDKWKDALRETIEALKQPKEN